MSQTTRMSHLLLLAVVAGIGGCQTLPKRPLPVHPKSVQPDYPLRRLAAWKHPGVDNRVFLLTEKNTSLPAEAAPLEPLLGSAFGLLQPSGVYFYPGSALLPAGRTEKGDPDFAVNPADELFEELAQRYRNSDGSPAEVKRIRASAHMDRDVYRVRKNATLRGIAETKGGYIEADADFQVEDAVSVLTIMLAVQEPTREMTPYAVQIKAEVLKQSQGAQLALFVFGSGGKLGMDVVVTQGLSQAIETCVARAVLELCAQSLGTDPEQFLHGAPPPSLAVGPRRAVSNQPAAAPPPAKPASAPAERLAEPNEPAAPKEFCLEYQLRTRDGLTVDSDPAVLHTGERFTVLAAPRGACALYLVAENQHGYALLHPRPGDTTAIATPGSPTLLPRTGSFQLDASAGLDKLILVAGAAPIAALENVYQHPGDEAQSGLQIAMHAILQKADQDAFSRTKLPGAMRICWLVAGQTSLAVRIPIEHR